MSRPELPSFWNVMAYLCCAIICFAMLLVEFWIVSITGMTGAPLSVWPLAVALVLVIAWSCLRIVRALFPAWFRIGHSGTVLKEVMEIEGRV